MIVTGLDVVLLIAIALLLARVFGHLFDKVKQPAVIGEIFAGIFLGAIHVIGISNMNVSVLGLQYTLPSFDFSSEGFTIFAQIGILFLLFISGLETSFSQLKKTEKASISVAIGGVIVPLVLGIGASHYLGFSLSESVVIGLILVATSVGVTVRSLMDIHMLDSDVGTAILGSAVIDDVLGVLLLAFVLGVDSPLVIGVKIVLFFVIFLYLGLKVIDKLLDLGDRIHLPKAFLSISLAFFLLIAFFADQAGIAGIIGAFVAGLLIGNTLKSRKIVDDVQAIGYGFFIPLFFVWVGAHLWEGAQGEFSSFATIGLFAFVLIIVAVIGKIIGCGMGAKLVGMSSRQSLQIGVGMIPRMELALIIASSAVSYGFFVTADRGHQVLAVTIILTIATTLIAPFLIKAVFKKS